MSERNASSAVTMTVTGKIQLPQIWEDVHDYLEIAPGYAKGHRLV